MKIQAKLGLLIIAVFAVSVFAAGRQSPFVTPTSVNNGNTRAGFMVAVTTTAWSTVLSSDVRRRYAVIHTTSTSVVEICLSTVSAAATTCTADTEGRHFPHIGTVVEDHSEAALYARGIAGDVESVAKSVNLYGETQYDSTDVSSY